MSRPLRVLVADGWHHVTVRGNEHRAIFQEGRDHARFLEYLEEMAQRYGVRSAAYVLMGNHYHLALQTPQANLSAAMKRRNVSYSVWHNRKHQRAGRRLQGDIMRRRWMARAQGWGRWPTTRA